MRWLLFFIIFITCQSTNDSLTIQENQLHETAFLHLISNDSSFSGTSSNAARSRIIETKYGKVQGLSITLFPNSPHHQTKNYLLKNKVVEIFLGIPYASPPIKTHRFSPTQTPIPWDGIKATVKPGYVCPQMMPDIRNESAALNEMPKGYLEYLRKIEPYFRNQSEDCLYLNIYTPIGADQKLRPVLVYIHGGKFAWGSGNLSDGTVMAAYADILFVTINYRLGVLGFLNTNPSPSTKPRVANYGLMDQIAALHWIKENIMSFGGDPENITLMGYEAGAACIHFLMSSPAVTPGLFHRSILIAGSSHAPWALIPDPAAAAAALSQALNCSSSPSSSTFPLSNLTQTATSATTTPPPPQNPHGKSTGPFSSTNQDPILDCLKNKHFSYFTKFYPPKFSVDFGPSIDGVVIRTNFRVSGEGQMGKRDVSKKYDLLFGVSSLEKITAFSEADLEFGFEAQRRDAILRTLVRNSYRFHLNEILATVTNEYIDWEKSVQHPIATRDLTVNAVTDCLSLAPVVAASDSTQIRKSYFYVFEHSTKDGPYNYQRSGAGGGEEVNYMLGAPLIEIMTGHALPFVPPPLPSNYSKNEMALSELLITYISNFVHNGDPNEPLKTDAMWPVSKERNRFKSAWEQYDKLHQKYLEISTNKIRTRSHYRAHQMAVWLRLVPELQKSGAQFASNLHNRLKGGSDPSLYVGSLKLLPFEEEPPSAEMEGYIDSGQGNFGPDNGPPSPPTTCFSPLSAASPHDNANTDNSHGASLSAFGKNVNAKFNETSLEPSYFTPYSTALSITIAIGCSLLILNVFIFALVYYQRDKKRAEMMKATHANNQGHQSNSDAQNKYGEPPELLKSNSTTASTLHHSMSQSQLQSVQSDSCHSHGSFNIQHTPPSQQQYNKQTEQISLGQRGIVLSPSQTHHQNHPHLLQHSASVPPQMLAVATLPRSNGGVGNVGGGAGNLSKPQPPPRTTTTAGTAAHTNFSTLPHNIHWSAQNLNFVILFGYIIINILS